MNNVWQKLTITAEKQILEIISADLVLISNGIIEDNDNHIHFIEIDDVPLIEEKLNKYNNQNISFQFEEQKKENWHLAWKDNFTKINVKDKLIIVPDWDNSNDNKKNIKIKPGMAFGTGHHETTYLMLEQLIEIINPNVSVLDLGSGSGVLSIAAKKLGADNVVAVEFDRECEENFYENLALNNLTNEIPVHFMDVLEWKDFNFNLILANINKTVIKKMIPILSENSSSKIILTGLLIDDKSEIISLLERYHFKIEDVQYKGEWMLVSINK